jgi:hypothetical protein
MKRNNTIKPNLTKTKIVVDSAVNCIWLKISLQNNSQVNVMLWTNEVDKLVEVLKKTLAHCGHWTI